MNIKNRKLSLFILGALSFIIFHLWLNSADFIVPMKNVIGISSVFWVFGLGILSVDTEFKLKP